MIRRCRDTVGVSSQPANPAAVRRQAPTLLYVKDTLTDSSEHKGVGKPPPLPDFSGKPNNTF